MSASKVATTKRVDDLAEVILEHENKYKAIEELEKVRREVFLFEYYNNRDLSVKALVGLRYIIEDRQLGQQVIDTRDFYAFFGIRVNKITDLLKKIKMVYFK